MPAIIDEDGMLVAASPDLPVQQLANAIILGWIFPQGLSDPACLSRPADKAMDEAEFDRLCCAHWGSFIALFRRPDHQGFRIYRSPFGNLPGLLAMTAGQTLLASDLAGLAVMGWRHQGLDWSMLLRRLALRDMPATKCCLSGVQELRGGTAIAITQHAPRHLTLWSPWDHAGRGHWLREPRDAPPLVRRAILTATRAATRGSDHRLLLLSGGLDSSLLAAALGTSGGHWSGLNLACTGTGDERDFARRVAAHMGTSLDERDWDLGHVDLMRSSAIDRPNPVARSFMQGTACRLREAVAASGADLSIDGGGGDNMFLSARSVAPVSDAWRHGHSPVATFRTAATLSALAQTSMATIFWRAGARAFRASPAYRWHPDLTFLAEHHRDDPVIAPDHPWLIPPRGAETGTALHIALMISAQGWAEACDLDSPVRHASPLASQPVAEACLRIPSWWWYGRQCNRLVARDAFRDRLPPDILARRTKGAPDSFVARLFAANRSLIRTMLLDGALASQGLLDRPAIEHALDDKGIVQGMDYHRLMQLVDVEAWVAGQT
jgi:asparagine synthase (glutamine-hydrolysing)